MASVSPKLNNNNNNSDTTTDNNNISVRGQDSLISTTISLEQDSNISSSNPKNTSDSSDTHQEPHSLYKSTTSDSDSVCKKDLLEEVTTKTEDHHQSFNNTNFKTQEDINISQNNSTNMFSASSGGGINSNNGSTSSSSNNTSDSSISSSTNPSFSSIAGGGGAGAETEFEGPTDLGTNYRASCVAEDDAGSSSHSEVRSSSPGLVDADADVEDSPSGSEQETGSESERGGTSVMYAPNTVGFPPSRSSLTHTIPTGANFVNTARLVPGSNNPFAVKAGSISSSTSGSNSVSNIDYCSSSSNGNSRNSTNSFSGNSLSRGGVATGRWGTCQPQKPLSWSSRPIIRPSALGSSLGSGVSSTSPPPLSSPLSSSTGSSTPNYFTMSNDNAADQSETNTGLSSSTSSSFVLRPPKLPFGLATSTSTSTTTIRASQFTKSILSESSCFSTSKQVTEGTFVGNEAVDNTIESNLQNKSDNRNTNNEPSSSTTPTSNQQQNVTQESKTNDFTTTKPSCIFVPLEKENNHLFESGCNVLSTSTAITTNTITSSSITTNIFSGVNGNSDGGGDQQIRSFASIGQSVSNISSSSSSSSLTTPSSSVNTAISSAQSTSTNSAGSNSNFVFGSNLLQRISNTPGVSTDKTDEQPSNGISSSSTSTSDGLFCAALRNVQGTSPLKSSVASTSSTSSGDVVNSSGNPLSGVIKAFENSEAQNAERKRKFESGPVVVTGEEDESNVIQISCRLFAFNSVTSSWTERGRGVLRVNDRASNESNNDLQSRVIVRSKGSLRVMLNTNVWSDMKVDRTSDKSVRLTANDNGHIRLFLVMATVNECDQLYNAVDWRVRTLQSIEDKQAATNASLTTTTSVSGQVDGDDYEDDEPSFKMNRGDNDTMKELSRKRSSSEGLQHPGVESEINHSRSEDEDHERVSGHGFNNGSSDDDDDEDDESNSPSKKKRFLDTASETNNLQGNNLSRQTPTIRINNEECLD